MQSNPNGKAAGCAKSVCRLKAAGIRALKTVAQTAIATIGTAAAVYSERKRTFVSCSR